MGYLYDLADDFVSLLFPRLCHGCRDNLLRGEELVCLKCRAAIPRTGFEKDRDNAVEQLLWGRCYIQKATAFSYYSKGSRIRKIIHDLKYKGFSELGDWAGKYYGALLLDSGFLEGIDIIMPVPLHSSKKRKRGYNQAELICKGLSAISGIPVNNKSLLRVTNTDSQTRRSRFDRWKNVETVFRLADYEALSGKHILLVDDVITTGSTIESCANELLKSSGVKVSVMALAVAVQ